MNLLKYATIFQRELDKAAIHDLLTGWMDANAGQVKYSGGKEVKIPTLSTVGLADYGRKGNTGYVAGDVSMEYQTVTMTQDRGRSFSIDKHDVDETNFVATVGNIMGTFQREHVVPEIDAYRLSMLAAKAPEDNIKEGYTPSREDIVYEIKLGINKIRKTGYNGPLVIHMTYDALLELEMAMLGKITDTTFSVGGIDTTVPSIDRVPIIETPENRMYTSIELYDGKTAGQEVGGYTKGANAQDINFIIVARTTPIAVTKQDSMRIFDPETNQKANAWAMDYRRYHDLWVKDKQATNIYVNTKGAAVEG